MIAEAPGLGWLFAFVLRISAASISRENAIAAILGPGLPGAWGAMWTLRQAADLLDGGAS